MDLLDCIELVRNDFIIQINNLVLFVRILI